MSASPAPLLPSSTAFYSLCSFFQPPYPQSLHFHLAISQPLPIFCFNSVCLPLLSFPSPVSTSLSFHCRIPSAVFLCRSFTQSCFISLSSSPAGIFPPLTLTQSHSIYSLCAASTSLLHSFPQFILAHFFFSSPLFSLKPYLLPVSVAGYKTLPQPPSACLCMKADTVIEVLTLWGPLGPWHFQHPLSFFSYV